jgi:hypothetical protein
MLEELFLLTKIQKKIIEPLRCQIARLIHNCPLHVNTINVTSSEVVVMCLVSWTAAVETTAGPHPVTTARHGVCSCKNHKLSQFFFQKNKPRDDFFPVFWNTVCFQCDRNHKSMPTDYKFEEKRVFKEKLLMAESNILVADIS